MFLAESQLALGDLLKDDPKRLAEAKTVLEDSITLVCDHYGEQLDLAHLPQDDPKTYTAIQKADTVGMFQIESRAQMASLPRNCPQKFYDLVVQVALIRPGPIVGQMTSPYLRRRQGRGSSAVRHSVNPVLAPVAIRPEHCHGAGIPVEVGPTLRISTGRSSMLSTALKILAPAPNRLALRHFSLLIRRHHELVWEMTRREILDRYTGQVLGSLWAIGLPLLSMAVYTAVFLGLGLWVISRRDITS